eukprot:525150-Rhodomonas_salina.1
MMLCDVAYGDSVRRAMYWDSVWCYAISSYRGSIWCGTELGYAPTHLLRHALYCASICCYGMQCPERAYGDSTELGNISAELR